MKLIRSRTSRRTGPCSPMLQNPTAAMSPRSDGASTAPAHAASSTSAASASLVAVAVRAALPCFHRSAIRLQPYVAFS